MLLWWVEVLFLDGEGKPAEGRTRMDVVVGWWVLCEVADADFVPWCAFVVEVPVGICTCPSESCVAPAAPTEEEGDEEDKDEDEDEDTPPSRFEIPNCVEYWNFPVASSMI